VREGESEVTNAKARERERTSKSAKQYLESSIMCPRCIFDAILRRTCAESVSGMHRRSISHHTVHKFQTVHTPHSLDFQTQHILHTISLSREALDTDESLSKPVTLLPTSLQKLPAQAHSG